MIAAIKVRFLFSFEQAQNSAAKKWTLCDQVATTSSEEFQKFKLREVLKGIHGKTSNV